MLRANQLDADRAFALVIDLQEKLLPLIEGRDRILRASLKLLQGLHIFQVPVIATEQYVKGLGPTHASLRDVLVSHGSTLIEKPTFSACGFDPVREAIIAVDRPQVVVVGIEAHICVLQTALDLVTMDYDVFVCADGVGSRSRLDYDCALQRLRQEGAYVTTVESVLFELCERCDGPLFKQMIEVIKASPSED